MLSAKNVIIQYAAVVQGDATCGTTTLRKHKLDGLNAVLWDSWGLISVPGPAKSGRILTNFCSPITERLLTKHVHLESVAGLCQTFW